MQTNRWNANLKSIGATPDAWQQEPHAYDRNKDAQLGGGNQKLVRTIDKSLSAANIKHTC
jgi:hypothetical protein